MRKCGKAEMLGGVLLCWRGIATKNTKGHKKLGCVAFCYDRSDQTDLTDLTDVFVVNWFYSTDSMRVRASTTFSRLLKALMRM